jgi:hypothetical protein
VSLKVSCGSLTSKCLMKKMGKWSLIDQRRMPLKESAMIGIEVHMLSINVAELLERRVGLLMTGNRDCVKLILVNSAVGGWVSELRRLRLKSPRWMHSYFSWEIRVNMLFSFVLNSTGSEPSLR